MKKKFTELSAAALRTKRKGKNSKRLQSKDEDIDYSDIPELTDENFLSARRPGRPVLGTSKRVSKNIRIEEDVFEKLKAKATKKGIGYGTLINRILKKAV